MSSIYIGKYLHVDVGITLFLLSFNIFRSEKNRVGKKHPYVLNNFLIIFDK